MLLANKCDMETDRVISTQDGELLAKVWICFLTANLCFCVTCSAKFHAIFYCLTMWISVRIKARNELHMTVFKNYKPSDSSKVVEKQAWWWRLLIYCAIHTCYFNGHFPCWRKLACCVLDFQSLVVLIRRILAGQAKTVHTHIVLQIVPCLLTLTTVPSGSETKFYMHWILFMSPSQWCWSTEGIHQIRVITLSLIGLHQ